MYSMFLLKAFLFVWKRTASCLIYYVHSIAYCSTKVSHKILRCHGDLPSPFSKKDPLGPGRLSLLSLPVRRLVPSLILPLFLSCFLEDTKKALFTDNFFLSGFNILKY